MKRFAVISGILIFFASGAASCKKCSSCTSVDATGKTIASEKYCSTSDLDINTFETSFKRTYGHTCTCKRE